VERSERPDQDPIGAAVRTIARVWATAMADSLRPLLAAAAAAADRSDANSAGRDLPVTLSVNQAAKVLGLSRAGTYEAVQRGDLPSLRIGRRILIPTRRLVDLLEQPPGATGLE
jgi:excisionase family DNA binding protein